ncbi:MAG TPA: HD domain-containing protein [Chthonomonadaceae bacterium]|nr:HD domain-containing protein [Chthonomonadaceae bacterium]
MRDATAPEIALPGVAVEPQRSQRTDHLNTLRDSVELAAYLRAEREALMERIRQDAAVGGLAMARAFSDLMDAVISRMFALACARVGANPEILPIVIVATGGYGRRELSPFSDIDITFIPYRDGDPQVDRVIRDMFTQVMDVCIARCGLEVGYAYRLLEDCSALDHQTACGLLDARRIIGSNRLFIQLEDAFWMGFNPTDFIFTKLEERRRALTKWGQTPRVVEPQLKEGPGGLRDLQTAVWLVQARANLAAARVRGERAFEALIREADVSPADAARLAEAKEFLFRVRNALHALAGAERDTLVITRQEDVAASLGYEAGPALESEETATLPVERFMADLYPRLALVRRVSDQIMRHVGNSRLLLGIGLDCRRRQIVPANEALETDDPAWMLWACELAQKYDLTFGERLERAIVTLAQTRPALADPLAAAQVFTRILSKTGKVYPILQRMADLGVLGWFLPEFGDLMDLIPYDPSHDYTVGQHSLLAVQHLEELLTAEGSEDLMEMRRLLEELPHPEQLILAILLHDSGKATPGKPHAEVSEEVAEAVCRRLGWPEEAAANVRFLVRYHLLMAETSRLRDLHQDETIREFTRQVNDLDRLNMLYLLTYADTRAVGAGVWTQVKGRFLRDLWRRAAAVLSDEEPVGYDDAAIARARRRLLKDLSPENLPEEEVAEHVQAMPPEYLLNQSLSNMALHIGFIRKVRAGQPVIDFHDERDATYTEVTICAYDDPQPGLLAKIAGVFYAAGLNTHSAQVMTRVTSADRIALDTLWVDFRGRQLSPGKRREVAANLTAVLTGAQSVGAILQKARGSATGARGRAAAVRSPSILVRSVRNDLSDTLTYIETSGPDEPGTFYRVCDALSHLGWDIRSARASTWQGEARSSFYVAGARHLSETEAQQALAQILPQTEAAGDGRRP